MGLADPDPGPGGHRGGGAAAGRASTVTGEPLWFDPAAHEPPADGRVRGAAAAAVRRADPDLPGPGLPAGRPGTRTRRARTCSSARSCWGTRTSAPGGVRSGAARSRSRWRWLPAARRPSARPWPRRPRRWPGSSAADWTLRSPREHSAARPRRAGHCRQRAVHLTAPPSQLAGRAVRAGPRTAPKRPATQPGGLGAARRAAPTRWTWCVESHQGRVPELIPIRVARMVDLPVRVPARHRRGDGRRRRRPAGHRDHPGGLRRRPPGQLRVLRLARGRAGDRPERLRRGASRVLGVGPAPAGGQRLGGRPGERRRPRSSARRRCWPVSRRTGPRCASWPRSRC